MVNPSCDDRHESTDSISINDVLGICEQDRAIDLIDEGRPSDVPSKRQSKTNPQWHMSKISQMYDTGRKGYLDEAEKKLRDMDRSNRGFITNDKAHELMTEQLNLQAQMFNMKRVVLGLSLFTILLAFSNLATAWAAALLAKETTIDKGTSDMMTKDGGHMIGTQAKGATHSAVPVQATEEQQLRHLALWDSDASPGGTAWMIDESIATDCDANVLVRIKYACPDFTVRYQSIDCDHYVHYATTSSGMRKFRDSANGIDLACAGGVCVTTGLGCRKLVDGGGLAFGEACYEDSECESGLCLGGVPPHRAGMCDKSVREGSLGCPHKCGEEQRCDDGACVDLLVTCPTSRQEAEEAEDSGAACLMKDSCRYEPNCCEDGSDDIGYQYECFCDDISGQFGPCWSKGLSLGCHDLPPDVVIEDGTSCTEFCGDGICSPWEEINGKCPTDC